MKGVKILIAVLCFLAALIGLFLLMIFSTKYTPDKTEDINILYIKKPPYLLGKKSYYTAISWDIGSAVSGAGADIFFEGGEMTHPKKDSVEFYFSGIKNYLSTLFDIDFVLLQEVDRRSRRSYSINQTRMLDTLMPNFAGCFAINHNLLYYPLPLFNPYGNILSGIKTMSTTFPLESVRFSFEKRGSSIRQLFSQNNCCIINDYRMRNGRTLVVINVHFGDFAVKEVDVSQIKLLLALMLTEYEQGNYVIAGGNWNVTLPSDSLVISKNSAFNTTFPYSSLPEGWKVYFDSQTPTVRDMKSPYNEEFTKTGIVDFFIASPDIQVLETKTDSLAFRYSNHQPVRIKFRLK